MKSQLSVVVLLIGILLGTLFPQTVLAQDVLQRLDMVQLQAAPAQDSTVITVFPQPDVVVSATDQCYNWLMDDNSPSNQPSTWETHQWAGAHTNGLSWHDAGGDGASVMYIMWQDPNWGTATSATVVWWRYEEAPVGTGGSLIVESLSNSSPSGFGWSQPSGSIGEVINGVQGAISADRLEAFNGVKVYASGGGRRVGFDSVSITKCFQPPATATPTNTPLPTATDTPLPTATNTPLPTATPTYTLLPTATNTPPPTATPMPTATNTPLPTATPLPTYTNTSIPAATNTPITPVDTPTNAPSPTATSITPVNVGAGVITTTVSACQKVYLPLVRRTGGSSAEAASTAVTTTVAAAQCMVVPAAILTFCPGGWTTDWAVYVNEQPEIEYGRKMTCKSNSDFNPGSPALVTIVTEASTKGDPRSAIAALVTGVLAYTVNAVWQSYDGSSAIGSNQFVVSSPALVDEWFSGQLYRAPTGIYYGHTYSVDQYPDGHVKYYAQPAAWPTSVRIVKAESAHLTDNDDNLALVQYKLDKDVYSFLIQKVTATDGELVTEVTGDAATVVSRVWREAIRANNTKMLAAPEKYFQLYQSWAAGSQQDNSVDAELYLAAPSNSSNYVVVSSDYAVVAGDRVLDQHLKLWGAIKVGGGGKSKSTAYAIYLSSNEWYEHVDPSDPDYVATMQVPDFKYRPVFLPGAHTTLQELTDALGQFTAAVLDHIEAARTQALARVQSKREKCWQKGRYWDEVEEKCKASRPVPDKPRRGPNEDEDPDLPDHDQDPYYPIVAIPSKDANSWGHARKTRGWVWADDVNDVINNFDTTWRFIGYAKNSADTADPGAHAAFVLEFDQPHEVDRQIISGICVPYKFAEEPGGNGYWFIATAYPYSSDVACLKPLNGRIDSTIRMSPPKK